MDGNRRVRIALLVGTLAGGMAARANAQIPGMPLFTNPRYATGVRVHADIGQPTEAGTALGDYTVVQGGVTFALGPLGLGANVGMNLNRAQELAAGGEVSADENFTGSAIAQIRVAGGGPSNLSLSLFGGASTDVTTYSVAAGTQHIDWPKYATFPVGVAVGVRIPLGLASLNIWGAPRMTFSKFVDCPSSDPVGFPGLSTICDETENNFRWAVGADLPIFRIISVRAAYDSGKIEDQTVSYIGVGASIGIGGMR